MNRFKQILSLLSVVLFISYYASTFLFVHTHTDESGKLFTHSHPYSSANHTHSTNALLLINHLTTLLFISNSVIVCMALLSVLERLFLYFSEKYTLSVLIGGNLKRGPPTLT